MDAAELAASEKTGGQGLGQLSFGQLGLRASRLKLPYYRDEDQGSGEEADDEVSRSVLCKVGYDVCMVQDSYTIAWICQCTKMAFSSEAVSTFGTKSINLSLHFLHSSAGL